MRMLYCWRCQREMPMLDEEEYALFLNEAFLKGSGLVLKNGELEFFPDAYHEAKQRALDLYYLFTGYRETNINAVYHHRLSLYGPPCGWCGKPLRTPKAKICAACWTPITCLGGAE